MNVELSKQQQDELLAYAYSVITNKLNGSQIIELSNSAEYQENYGVFVSLHKSGKLRGCVGYIEGVKPLDEAIKEMALSSAFGDDRFDALCTEELETITIEISILSPLEKIDSTDNITVGEHGLYIQNDYHSGILLPQVATEYKLSKEEFLHQVCIKAGIDDTQFSSCDFYKFTALVF